MDITKIDERIMWQDMKNEDCNFILWMLDCWRTMRSGITFSEYCTFRCEQRGIETVEIYDTIAWGRLVEFHIKDGSPRVLIRRHRSYFQDLCIVLDVIEGEVITAYTNARDDYHNTLGDIYNKNLDVKNILNKCMEFSK